MFENFKSELSKHNANGYHRLEKYSENFEDIISRKYSFNQSYIDFINSIGYGRFFDGSLVLFPLRGKGSVDSETSEVRKLGFTDYVVIGYDGTTSGYFCLKNDKNDEAVYWIDIQTKVIENLSVSFEVWIESTPKELFNKKAYASYKEIKDLDSIEEVVRQRSLVDVELLDYDKKLVKPPNKKDDLLPRYNKLNLLIFIKEQISLDKLTVSFLREGSPIGDENVSHITLEIDSLPLGKSNVIESYLFDPFNLSFDNIKCTYDPEIDLSSKSRIRYKEIVKYL